MKIEINEKGTPEFYKEVVCTTAQYARLVKNPEAKLVDSFKAIKTYIILCCFYPCTLSFGQRHDSRDRSGGNKLHADCQGNACLGRFHISEDIWKFLV